jgi:hypothetical protein
MSTGTTAVEEHLHGPDAVIALLAGDPRPAPTANHELRDGDRRLGHGSWKSLPVSVSGGEVDGLFVDIGGTGRTECPITGRTGCACGTPCSPASSGRALSPGAAVGEAGTPTARSRGRRCSGDLRGLADRPGRDEREGDEGEALTRAVSGMPASSPTRKARSRVRVDPALRCWRARGGGARDGARSPT